MIHFITGGARSGKSNYAQTAALQLTNSPVYIATSQISSNDEEFMERVNRHKSDRDERWTTYETPLYISKLPLSNKVIVIDCVTLWLTNLFSLHKMDINICLQSIQSEIDALKKIDATFFIISNEIGMGVHAETAIGRKFTDLQGWANQYIAACAMKVVFMIAGLPLTIKEINYEI